MKKRILLGVGLFLLSAMPFSVSAGNRARAKRDVIQNATIRQFLSSSIGSLALGGLLGAATGGGIAYVQNGVVQYLGIESVLLKTLLTAASCTFGLDLCNNMIAGVQNNLDNDEIAYNNNLMSRAAIVAAVLAYLHA